MAKTEQELKREHPELRVIHCNPESHCSMSFKCPWCGTTHYHGRGSGTRASHCEQYQGEYILIDPSDQRQQ